MMKVSIITPTTGSNHLRTAIESVRAQTAHAYSDIQHLIVVDGEDRRPAADRILTEMSFNKPGEDVIYLPYATGIDRYNGHRIYGAATFLAKGDYFIFLDDDNELEPHHVNSLVTLVTENKLSWAFSMRKIIDQSGAVVCLDDCESLGMWPSILGSSDYFVDVNCYFIAREIAVQLAPVWYRKFREPGVMEVDRAMAGILRSNNLRHDSTRDYTVRYRAANTGISVQAEFFQRGNEAMLQRHGGKLPWKQPRKEEVLVL